MPFFTFNIWDLQDFDGNLGNTPVTGTNDASTTGSSSTGTSTLDSGAVQLELIIEDNDDSFTDGFLDTNGQQILAAAITIGGTTYPIGAFVEYEFSVSDAGPPEVLAVVIRIDGDNVGVLGSNLEAGETYNFDSVVDETGEDFDVLCFTRGTQIAGLDKSHLVEELKVGDLVKNKAGEFVEIRWIGKTHFSQAKLLQFPHLRPIQFSAGSLGENIPSKKLTVSPQHRMYLNNWRAELMFGFSNFLAPAKALLNDSTVRLAPIDNGVEYYHVMFDKHEIINANGQWTESFYPGSHALNILEQAAQDELFEIFPELREATDTTYPMTVPCLKTYEMKALQT